MEEITEKTMVRVLVEKCRAMGMTDDENYVIGCFTFCQEAIDTYGSELASAKKTLEILSDSTAFGDASLKIGRAIGINL